MIYLQEINSFFVAVDGVNLFSWRLCAIMFSFAVQISNFFLLFIPTSNFRPEGLKPFKSMMIYENGLRMGIGALIYSKSICV